MPTCLCQCLNWHNPTHPLSVSRFFFTCIAVAQPVVSVGLRVICWSTNRWGQLVTACSVGFFKDLHNFPYAQVIAHLHCFTVYVNDHKIS